MLRDCCVDDNMREIGHGHNMLRQARQCGADASCVLGIHRLRLVQFLQRYDRAALVRRKRVARDEQLVVCMIGEEVLRMEATKATPTSPTFEQRPWGSYTILDEGHHYKVKRLEVLPGKRL